MTVSRSTRALGTSSAMLCTILALAYVAAQLAEWLGWLGSAGGSESTSTARGLVLLLVPSLLLAPFFVLLLVSVHDVAAPENRTWSRAAVAFGIIYAVLVSLVYFVQLTLIAPRLASGNVQGLEPFLFVPFESFLYAVDILGYSFMSLATLLAARAFPGDGPERVARAFLTANGLLLPFIALQMYFHWMIWVASLWAITFPGATVTLTLLFRRLDPART